MENRTVVEGIFTGDKMLGNDNMLYVVPPNYASKSRLVVGDKLKLTITAEGDYVFKQIGPVPRKTVEGTVNKTGKTCEIIAGDKIYKILNATVTFFKLMDNERVIIILPQSQEADWAAVEGVIREADEDKEL